MCSWTYSAANSSGLVSLKEPYGSKPNNITDIQQASVLYQYHCYIKHIFSSNMHVCSRVSAIALLFGAGGASSCCDDLFPAGSIAHGKYMYTFIPVIPDINNWRPGGENTCTSTQSIGLHSIYTTHTKRPAMFSFMVYMIRSIYLISNLLYLQLDHGYIILIMCLTSKLQLITFKSQ